MNKTLGNQIKTLRTTKNLTTAQMANKLDISEEKYVAIETGTVRITFQFLCEIADALRITVKDITAPVETTDEPKLTTGPVKIHEMLDLFYANKHMYERLRKTN